MHLWLLVRARDVTSRPEPRHVPGPVAFLSNRIHDPRVLAVTPHKRCAFERGDPAATMALLGIPPENGWAFGTHLGHHDRLMRAHAVWSEVLGPPNWGFTLHQGIAKMVRGWTRDALFLANPADVRRLDLWGKAGQLIGQEAAERTGISAYPGWQQASIGLVFPAENRTPTSAHERFALLGRIHTDLALAGRVLHTGSTVLHELG
jgi:hypothetical protein